MQSWQLQEAKARMSELVKSAQQQPQQITLHGKPVVVVLSKESFDRLTSVQGSLLEFMQRSPLAAGDEVVLERDSSMTRAVQL
jgi:prevent-host-death family protein